jgi:AcrR family transcriptional regulator
MPATRPHVDREVKQAEILDAAETLLLRDGYDATTMVAVARAAGVANNAIYWYFPGKDEVLAAVLRRRQARALAELEHIGPGSVEKRVRALLAQLDQVAMLTATVHERARRSEAVADQHRSFHKVAEQYLDAGFRSEGLTGQNASRAAAAIMAMVEGIHLHEPHRDVASRDRLIMWTLRRLLASAKKPAAARAR